MVRNPNARKAYDAGRLCQDGSGNSPVLLRYRFRLTPKLAR